MDIRIITNTVKKADSYKGQLLKNIGAKGGKVLYDT
jgi:hypothetical protein